MGLFSRILRRPVGSPHGIHPADEDLIDEADVAWFSALTEKDIRSLSQVDDVHRMAAYLKFKDEGQSDKDAVCKVRRYFPVFYFDPSKRGEVLSGTIDNDAELPFLIKDKVNGLALEGRLSRDLAERFGTMNAAIRHVLRGG